MRTLLISGSDTGIGKTRVTGVLAALLPATGEAVQLVKPVETGVRGDGPGDAENALGLARKQAEGAPGGAAGRERVGGGISAHTLSRFPDPLAPMAAAGRAGTPLDCDRLLENLNTLSACDWRLIEGAGGIAVPLGEGGFDWTDFAAALGKVHVVLVVPDRLGAINQARLTAHYVRGRALAFSIWLNEVEPQSEEIRNANRTGLQSSGITSCFSLRRDALIPEDPQTVRAFYRRVNAREPISSEPR